MLDLFGGGFCPFPPERVKRPMYKSKKVLPKPSVKYTVDKPVEKLGYAVGLIAAGFVLGWLMRGEDDE